ncbi:lipoyl domain-containing protein [Streptomyces sp. NPDC057580]|uniref:lipoyl domain-containing protein n=1 Tax=Streptomyces sp. NPDC057580 TaxID=3346173 RepID=UPI00367E0E50
MVDVIVPKWGLTMEEADIGVWHCKVGDTVAEGDPLVEIETDKVVNDLESPASGVLSMILCKQGTTVQPGDVIARIRPV